MQPDQRLKALLDYRPIHFHNALPILHFLNLVLRFLLFVCSCVLPTSGRIYKALRGLTDEKRGAPDGKREGG